MIIYGNGGRPFDRCDDFGPLRSSIGVGPQGDGIDVRVVEDDPYGYYRLQFLNSNTGEVLTTTPNLDPGSRFFVCTQNFTASTPYSTVFEASSTNFSTIQAITIQDARVGDLVIYHVFRAWPDDDNRYHQFLGFGAITSISNDGSEITFTKVYEFDTTMSIEDVSEELISSIVVEWLDEHPEATTTVQDGAVTYNKLSNDVKVMSMRTFETAIDMQNGSNLKAGMVCHTNGFYTAGDGGAAYYTVGTTGTANGMDVLALQGGLVATMIVTEPYVTPEQFGAYGDGTHDDAAYIQRAIDYLKGGTVAIQPKVYAVGDSIVLHRGIILSGVAPYDTSTGYGCTLKRMANVNKPVIQTPNAAGGSATHYMVIENLNIDGNGTEQTIETNTVEFYGAYIGSIIRNVRIAGHYGSGLSLRETDLQIDHLWISGGYTLTGAYAFDTGQGLPAANRSSMLNINHLYIENYANSQAGVPRTDETARADGLRLKQVASANINELHCEGCRVPVTITNSWNIKINMLRAIWCGLSSDDYSSMIYLQTPVRQLIVIGMFTTGTVNFKYWVSKGTSFTSNEVEDIAYDSRYAVLPMYIIGENDSATKLWLHAAEFANIVTAKCVGNYSNPAFIIKHPNGMSQLRLNGEYTEIGTSINQDVFKAFIQLQSYGNSSDRLIIKEPVQLGERTSAVNIYAGSIYRYTDARGTGPTYQRTTGSAATADKIVTARMLTASPTESATYVGEMAVDYSNKKVYIATSIGNGADDWSTLI